jgi:hypothetical protein
LRAGKEFSDEETFAYRDSHSHIDLPAGWRLAGPEYAEYRHTGGCRADDGARHACTDSGASHATGDRANDNRGSRYDDHDREGYRNEEKEVCKKDDPTAGDR